MVYGKPASRAATASAVFHRCRRHRFSTASPGAPPKLASDRLAGNMQLLLASEIPPDSPFRLEIQQRLHRGELTRVHHGTYLESNPADAQQVTAEIHHVARAFGFASRSSKSTLSGISAAALHWLPMLASRLRGPITVTRKNPGSRRPSVMVSRAELRPEDITSVQQLPVTTLKRTIQDLASLVRPHELLAAADAALRQGASLEHLSEPRRQRRLLRWIEAHASERAESYAESWSRYIFIQHDVPLRLEQVSVFDTDGNFVARCDFGTELGVLGEFDGRIKYDRIAGSSEAAASMIMAEKQRETRLRELGWDVVRWNWVDLQQPAGLLRRLRRQLESAASAPPPRGFIRLEPVKRVKPPDWRSLFELL